MKSGHSFRPCSGRGHEAVGQCKVVGDLFLLESKSSSLEAAGLAEPFWKMFRKTAFHSRGVEQWERGLGVWEGHGIGSEETCSLPGRDPREYFPTFLSHFSVLVVNSKPRIR